MKPIQRIATTINTTINTSVAILVSVVILLLPPVSYGVVSYLGTVATIDREAERLGLSINRIISNVPDLWTYQAERYRDLLVLGQKRSEAGKLTIFDGGGNEVVSLGGTPAWPAIAREATLFDAGTPVGRLEISRSLRELQFNLALLFVMGAALAFVAIFMLRILPLRALRELNAALQRRDAEIRFAHTVSTAAIEGAPDGVLVVDHDGHVVMSNRRFLDMWGIPSDTAEARIDDAIMRAGAAGVKDADAFIAGVIHLYKHPEVSARDRIEMKDGRVFDRHTSSLYTAEMKYLGRIWFFRDMTERETMESALRASEEKFRSLVETTSDFIWQVDSHRRVIYVSPATKAMFGYEPEEIVGRGMHEFMPPDEAKRFSAVVGPIVAARAPIVTVEGILLHKDGSEVTIEVSGVPVFDASGNYAGYRGINRDITDRKRAALALERRDVLLHAATLGATELASGSNLAEAMPKVLKLIGEAVQVDRISIIEQPKKPGDLAICQFSWKGPDSPLALNTGALMDTDETKSWSARSREGQVVLVNVSTLTGTTRKILDGHGVKTILLVPVVTGGEWWGDVAFDSCRAERNWEVFEIELLRTVTEMIGNAIRREKYVEQLRDTMRIVQNTPTILYRVSSPPLMVLSYISQNVKLFGYEPDELTSLPDPIRTIVHPDDLPKVLEAITAAAEGKQDKGVIEHRFLTGRGSFSWVENRYTAVRDANGRLLQVEGIMTDITERRAAEAKIAQLARTDALTGLANRTTFNERLRLAFASARRGATAFAVHYLDLDRFKDVNDTLGHPVGDQLLRSVARRLEGCTREGDLVARPGGDEFAILQGELSDVSDAGSLASKIRAALAVPILIEGNELHITASVGIAVYTPDVRAPDDMLARADLALYRAKQEGRDRYRFHSKEFDDQVLERVILAEELRDALDRQELELQYQPQVERSSGRILGMEALLRWNHPTRGQLKPPDFVSIAEKTGSITAIGKWVLDTACGQMSDWRKAGIAPPTIAVNISPVQIKNANEFLQTVTGTLTKWGLAESELELDVTEAMLAYTTLANNDILERLQSRGVRIAIDDFGTKFSSLDYLKSYHVSRIKIPRAMLDLATGIAEKGAMLRAITSMAHEMNVEVIAPGMETEAQWNYLASNSPTTNVQGYLYSEPVSAERAMHLLRDGLVRPSIDRKPSSKSRKAS